MKKLLFIILATLCLASCWPQKVVDPETTVVYLHKKSKKSPSGELWGVSYRDKMVIPVKYAWKKRGIIDFTIFFSNDNWQTMYLYHERGKEVFTDLPVNLYGFEPVAITSHQSFTAKEDLYGGKMFNYGDYHYFRTDKNYVYMLFYGGYGDGFVYGPFLEAVPGCGGYMFKDIETGKWGAHAYQHVEGYGTLKTTVVSRQVADPQYDEVMEVATKDAQYYWFVRSGEQWSCIDEHGKTVSFKSSLFNQARKLKLQEKSRMPNGKFPAQRIGVEGASVAFL